MLQGNTIVFEIFDRLFDSNTSIKEIESDATLMGSFISCLKPWLAIISLSSRWILFLMQFTFKSTYFLLFFFGLFEFIANLVINFSFSLFRSCSELVPKKTSSTYKAEIRKLSAIVGR